VHRLSTGNTKMAMDASFSDRVLAVLFCHVMMAGVLHCTDNWWCICCHCMKNHVAQLGLAGFRPVSFFSWPQFSFILHAVCNVTVLWLNIYMDRAGLFSQLLCITRCLDPPAERYISPVLKSCIHQIINRNPTHMSTENCYATVCHCSSSWAFVFDVLDWQHFRGCICSPSMQRVVILLHFSLLLYHCCYRLSLNHVNYLFHSLCERFNTVLLRVKCCQTVYYCYSVYC